MNGLQRVANCILTSGNKALLLQKPRRGWWVAPGGKMEQGESIKEAAEREFREETGISLKDCQLRAVLTMIIMDNDKPVKEWMMFTFQATNYSGELLATSPEGKLAWKEIGEVSNLPMAEGDKHIFHHILKEKGMMFGTFYYTKDFDLLSYRLEPEYT
ncbi:NUDIX hydrolase [Halalkalibacter oceani]|uniref:NUDIX hydrolase n=1 Tax=Halalkalibacter oceani TaxID=1653776 RepID=UPI003392C78D